MVTVAAQDKDKSGLSFLSVITQRASGLGVDVNLDLRLRDPAPKRCPKAPAVRLPFVWCP